MLKEREKEEDFFFKSAKVKKRMVEKIILTGKQNGVRILLLTQKINASGCSAVW